MSGSFLCPSTCGFAKVVALEVAKNVSSSLVREKPRESNTKYGARLQQEQYKQFNSYFSEVQSNFHIEFHKFQKQLPNLRNAVNKWNFRKADEKTQYLTSFSCSIWQKLSLIRKKEHSLSNCRGCAVRYSALLSFFPVKSAFLRGKAKSNPVFSAEQEANQLRGKVKAVKPLQNDIKNSAQAIYNKIAPAFEKTFDVTLAQALAKIPDLNLQHKTKNDIRSERRDNYRKCKENMEQHMSETAFLRCYGGRQSLNGWQRNRLALSFETKAAAKKRQSIELEDGVPAKVRKGHTGNFDSMTWDKNALRAEIEAYQDDHVINWRELAQRYNVCNQKGQLASNGGQIVKEWIISQGIDIERFPTKTTEANMVSRRRKRRGPGGEISIPTEAHPNVIKQQLLDKIRSGEYTIGEMIVPKKYEKLVLTKDLEIKKVEFVVEGRKTSLKDIRKDMYDKHKQFMRGNTDDAFNKMSEQELKNRLSELFELMPIEQSKEEMITRLKSLERTRHLMVWLDNSTVANHGYLACLVTCLYDPAVFLTNAEYKIKTGKSIDVQKTVEKPEVHFIARCGSSDCELLTYSETRLKCIQELKQTLMLDNIEYFDILRFGHGDNPLRAFETGQQKGGNYFCSTCGIHCSMTDDIAHVLNCKLITLDDRQDKVLQGSIARRNSCLHKAKPLNDLSKDEIEQDLASRRICEGNTKQQLKDLLSQEMRGIQRVPALLFNSPQASLEDLGLDKFEILPAEPLHDVGHHIENVLTEFPEHLSDEEKKIVLEAKELCLGTKDSKRTVDYRAALIKTTGVAHNTGKMSHKALLTLDTLVEMQRILYSPEEKRSPALILRYYNQSWLHSILLQQYITKPKKLTYRKLYGVYYHNLSGHAGLMLRIISGLTSNTENQERIFNHLKGITKSTSNYHPGQIIPNLFIRLQAERELRSEDYVCRQQSYISTLAKCLPHSSNTRIPISLIKKYSREWQAHLQQIGDFLLKGEGIWWRRDGQDVEFFDITNHPLQDEAGPPLHHFRSHSLASEVKYLHQCWNQCIAEEIKLPIHILCLDKEDGSTRVLKTSFLEDDKSGNDDDDASIHIVRGLVEKSKDNQELQDEDEEEEDEVLDIIPASDEIVDMLEPDSQHPVISSTSTKPTIMTEPDSSDSTEIVSRHDNQSSTTEQTDRHDQLQTRHGLALEVVLGCTEDVRMYDQRHKELRKIQNMKISSVARKYKERIYKEILQKIQQEILSTCRQLQEDLIKWEQNYVLNNNLISPSYEEMKNDKTASIVLNKLKYGKALLKEWKIKLPCDC